MADQRPASQRPAASGGKSGSARTGGGASGGKSGGARAGGAANTAGGAKAPVGARTPGGAKAANGSGSRGASSGSGQAAPVPGARGSAVPPAGPWLRWTTLILSLIGLGVSIYLTYEHFTTNTLAGCAESGTVNCAKVTTSSQSMVFGIFPVAVLGLAFFVFMVAANSPFGWRWNLPAFRWLRLGSVIVGIAFVLYLVYAELFQIQAICLYCTSVHVITFLLFVLIVFDTTFRQAPKIISAQRR
jgi:uncharacterized membrane protein